MIPFNDILEGIENYCGSTRGVGHTTAMLEGANRSPRAIVVAATLTGGMAIASKLVGPPDGNSWRIATLESFADGRLRGRREPLLWDNGAIEVLLKRFRREIDEMREALQVEVGQVRRNLEAAEARADGARRTNVALRDQLAEYKNRLESAPLREAKPESVPDDLSEIDHLRHGLAILSKLQAAALAGDVSAEREADWALRALTAERRLSKLQKAADAALDGRSFNDMQNLGEVLRGTQS